MDLTHIIQLVLAVVIAAMGFFLKRVIDQIDGSAKRVHMVELEVATLEAESREYHNRLKRIEAKLDRLLER